MADNVIVVGTKRAKQDVPVSEIRQMAGRAGRKTWEAGKVDILVHDDILEFIDKYKKAKEEEVVSRFANPDDVAFHLIADISLGSVQNMADAKRWAHRSFAAFQGVFDDAIVEKAIDLLVEDEAIQEVNDRFEVTRLGEIAASLYFHPTDIRMWRDNFKTLATWEELDDIELATWALANVKHYKVHSFGLGRDIERYEELLSTVRGYGLETEGIVVNCAAWASLLGWPKCKALRGSLDRLKDDFSRVHTALTRIFKVTVAEDEFNTEIRLENYTDVLDMYKVIIEKGCTRQTYRLMQLEGITKRSAMELFHEFDVRDRDDLIAVTDKISTWGTDELQDNLKRMGYIGEE